MRALYRMSRAARAAKLASRLVLKVRKTVKSGSTNGDGDWLRAAARKVAAAYPMQFRAL